MFELCCSIDYGFTEFVASLTITNVTVDMAVAI